MKGWVIKNEDNGYWDEWGECWNNLNRATIFLTRSATKKIFPKVFKYHVKTYWENAKPVKIEIKEI